MQINTKYHGIRDYEEEDIIYFKKGIPGFENLTKFIIFPAEENELFSIIHSIENADIGFVVISPFSVKKDYEFDLSDDRLEELKIISQEDVMVYCTITLNADIEKITTNLKAPIIINKKGKLGEQIILDNENYLIKYPLFKEGA